MKSTYTIILSFLALTANAQIIPNANFENWTTDTWPITPIGWVTEISDAQEPVSQDLDAYEGDFAMRVTSQETGIGEYASARTTFDITYIPATLDFYVKTLNEFGAVQVSITFYNEEDIVGNYNWLTSENIYEWTPIIIDMISIEPIVTHAEIVVSAEVGDLVAGDANISVDAMGFGTISGVGEIEKQNLDIYPNPATDVLHIQSPDKPIKSISLYDISGKMVSQHTVNTLSNQIDISELPMGAYTVIATFETGVGASQKLLIVR